MSGTPPEVTAHPESEPQLRAPPVHDLPPPISSPGVAPLRGAEVFARLITRLADPPCVQDRVVQRWERVYARSPTHFSAQLSRILPLLALVLDEIEIYRLPAEFALLPWVESEYRAGAAAAGGNLGMWQFSPATARHYGLTVQRGRDERLAPIASTRAAMRYLAALYNRFADWKLANMAFNAGEYRVLRALDKSPSSQVSAAKHLPSGLSVITYEHLAKVQALACLIAQPERFGIELPLQAVVDRLRGEAISADVTTLQSLARQAGLETAELAALNPVLTDGRIPPSHGREVLLPESALARLAGPPTPAEENEPASPVSVAITAASREHRVRRGDTLGMIAKRYGLRLRELLEWNGLNMRSLIHPGQRLRLEP